MKTKLLLSAFAGSAGLYAQITYTQFDTPKIDETYKHEYASVDSTVEFNLTVTGTGKNWDFSTTQLLNAYYRDYKIYPPTGIFIGGSIQPTFDRADTAFSSFPYDYSESYRATVDSFMILSSQCPACPVMMEDEGRTTNALNANGLGELILSLPSTYGTTFNTDYSPVFNYPGGIWGGWQGNYVKLDSEIDGYGTITNPDGKTYNCLRQKVTKYKLDSINYWGGLSVSYDTLEVYRWWANGIGFPVMQIEYYALYKTGNMNWIQSVSGSTGIHSLTSNKKVVVTPTITSDNVTITIDDIDNANTSIIITDLTGKQVAKQTLNNTVSDISLIEYDKGCYIYSVIENGKLMKTGKLIKQ